MVNNGQSCIAAKRFIVADAVYDAFARRSPRRWRALGVGDPLDPQTEVGPLATAAIRDASPSRSRARWRPARAS